MSKQTPVSGVSSVRPAEFLDHINFKNSQTQALDKGEKEERASRWLKDRGEGTEGRGGEGGSTRHQKTKTFGEESQQRRIFTAN